jgi:hypothetical protein
MIVHPCRRDVIATRRDDISEIPIVLIELISMVDPLSVGIETDHNVIIVKAKELIDGACTSARVFVGGKDAIPLNETEVRAIAINPEARSVAMIVDCYDLSLRRSTREVAFVPTSP